MLTPEQRLAQLEQTNIVSPRRRAELLGIKTYQGKTCIRGHSGVRYTNNRSCIQCHKADMLADRERARAYNQVYHRKHRLDPIWRAKENERMKKYVGKYTKARKHQQAVKENTLAAMMGVLA